MQSSRDLFPDLLFLFSLQEFVEVVKLWVIFCIYWIKNKIDFCSECLGTPKMHWKPTRTPLHICNCSGFICVCKLGNSSLRFFGWCNNTLQCCFCLTAPCLVFFWADSYFFCKSAEIWQDFVIIIFLFISSVGSLIRMPTRKVAGRGNKSAEAKAKQLRKDIKEKLQIRSNIWHWKRC